MPAIETLAVIGAGKLGREIAFLGALAGYRTILEDILPASLRRAQDEIRASLQQSIRSGLVSSAEAETALARLEYAGSVEEAARQADLVIEAVPDEMESKLEIFTLLDKVARPHTILATTTSTLRLSDIASITFRPQKIVGLRFLDAAGNDGLEVVHTAETDKEDVITCTAAAKRMAATVKVSVEDPSAGAS